MPAGYGSITPYLIVSDGAGAIEFYRKAFGAREKMRIGAPGGKIGHAELEFGDSLVMLADEWPEHEALSPTTVGGTPVTIHLYVKDVDRTVEQAVGAGAAIVRPVEDQFYGDRSGTVRDPYGHVWHVATHKEDVSPKEVERRAAAMMKPRDANTPG
ncbi:MAG: VOC family protein [Alphaproteobacteria bacterium]|nr:VOC family protein [Alphaproteobacteria bacterium]